jgi:hypothetical protein
VLRRPVESGLYLAIRYSERLAAIGAIGSVGDSRAERRRRRRRRVSVRGHANRY